jgi:hypothetical protein
VYVPPPGIASGSPWLSAQLALRLAASFGQSRFSRFARKTPAGFTLDHGIYLGPAIDPEEGGTALLFGYSLGIGYTD